MSALHFWMREKKTSVAEVDYLFPYEGKLIPIEVKSGSEGKLRSLHLFMDSTPHTIAVRFYAGEVSITKASTPQGKQFNLLNLPYYAVSQIEKYLVWVQSQVNSA